MSITSLRRKGRTAILAAGLLLAAAGTGSSAEAMTSAATPAPAKVVEIYSGGDISGPHSVAVASNTGTVYVAGNDAGINYRINVYSPSKHRIVHRWKTAGYVCSLTTSPDGRTLYVSTKSSSGQGQLRALRASTGVVLHRLTVSGGCPAVATSPDGTAVYASFGRSLRILSAGQLRTQHTIAVPTAVSGVAASSDGKRVYVALAGNRSTSARIDVVKLASDRVTGKVVLSGLASIAVAPDSAHIYAMTTSGQGGNRSGRLAVINARSLAVTGHIGIGRIPFDFALAPNGPYAYVVGYPDFQTAQESTINLTTHKVIRRTTTQVIPYSLAVTANGRTVYVATGLGGG